MLIRRRPILRAAAVGTVGYASYRAGKGAAQQQAQPEPAAPPAPPAPPMQAAAAAPPPAAPATSDAAQNIQALAELKTLLDSGAVTQEEYDRAKKGLLGAVN
jgi:hypothetical protein